MSLRRSAIVTSLVCVAQSFASAASFELTSANIANFDAALGGALTAETLISNHPDHITAYEPHLHAVITLYPRALDESRTDETNTRVPTHHPASFA